jgi:hypothetical protein
MPFEAVSMSQTEVPQWSVIAVPWLLAALVVSTSAAAIGVAVLVRRLRDLGAASERLQGLEDIRSSVQEMSRARGDLDLRRIEHVLIEIRDGQRRLEDAILRATQTPAAPAADARSADALGLSERIVQRLLAHGYDRVHVVPTLEELTAMIGAEGVAAEGAHDVLVEARRGGVLCKGRVLVRDGAVTDVELKPAYTMFP